MSPYEAYFIFSVLGLGFGSLGGYLLGHSAGRRKGGKP